MVSPHKQQIHLIQECESHRPHLDSVLMRSDYNNLKSFSKHRVRFATPHSEPPTRPLISSPPRPPRCVLGPILSSSSVSRKRCESPLNRIIVARLTLQMKAGLVSEGKMVSQSAIRSPSANDTLFHSLSFRVHLFTRTHTDSHFTPHTPTTALFQTFKHVQVETGAFVHTYVQAQLDAKPQIHVQTHTHTHTYTHLLGALLNICSHTCTYIVAHKHMKAICPYMQAQPHKHMHTHICFNRIICHLPSNTDSYN